VVVSKECVADRAEVPHKVNLFDMEMKYADVIPTMEVMEYFDTLSKIETQLIQLSLHPFNVAITTIEHNFQ
jgi:maleamate amidohydrolase